MAYWCFDYQRQNGYSDHNDEDYKTITYVHIYDNTAQDTVSSSAILSNTLDNIHILRPDVKKVYIRSVNAGCFHSTYIICCVPIINNNKNIQISTIDFSGPQGGKSIWRVAHIKAHIRRYVNKGNTVVTAMAFKQAIERTMPYVKVIIYATPNVTTNLFKIQN